MDILGLFVEGLLSFLSPCVLPLVPLYMSYLSSDGKEEVAGQVKYKTSHVFLMTVFFVLGISVVFIILAVSIDALKPIINDYSAYISLVGGILIIVFGLHETGIINIELFNQERRLKSQLNPQQMTYLKAFGLGFLFSFAWTPCIGPMLTSAILIAATSKLGSLYILVYALGLIIPFLITGLFTASILNFIKEKKQTLKYVMVLAGLIMIGYGCYMVYNAVIELKTVSVAADKKTETATSTYYVDDYIFTNQAGEAIKLTDYAGKYIFLNCTTTWCTYCQSEIPEYLSFAENNDECVCFYVMSSNTSGVSKEQLLAYIAEQGITVDVLFDEEGVIPGVSGYPTLYVVGKDGAYLGYVSGALNKESFKQILENVKEQ